MNPAGRLHGTIDMNLVAHRLPPNRRLVFNSPNAGCVVNKVNLTRRNDLRIRHQIYKLALMTQVALLGRTKDLSK